jgi:hypothetical protein
LAGVRPGDQGSEVLFYDTSTWEVIRHYGLNATNRNPRGTKSKDQKLENFAVAADTVLFDQSDPSVFFSITPYDSFALSRDGKLLALVGDTSGGKQLFGHFNNYEEGMDELRKTWRQNILIINIQNPKLSYAIAHGADSLAWSPNGTNLAGAGGGAEQCCYLRRPVWRQGHDGGRGSS